MYINFLTISFLNFLKFLTTVDFTSEFSSKVIEWLNMIIDLVVAAFTGAVSLFWDSTSGFTIPGILLLFALAMSVFTFAIVFIMKLIRK